MRLTGSLWDKLAGGGGIRETSKGTSIRNHMNDPQPRAESHRPSHPCPRWKPEGRSFQGKFLPPFLSGAWSSRTHLCG